MKNIFQNHRQISAVLTQSNYFSVNSATELTYINIKMFVINHTQIFVELKGICFWIWITDKHLRFLQTKHLQCSFILQCTIQFRSGQKKMNNHAALCKIGYFDLIVVISNHGKCGIFVIAENVSHIFFQIILHFEIHYAVRSSKIIVPHNEAWQERPFISTAENQFFTFQYLTQPLQQQCFVHTANNCIQKEL